MSFTRARHNYSSPYRSVGHESPYNRADRSNSDLPGRRYSKEKRCSSPQSISGDMTVATHVLNDMIDGAIIPPRNLFTSGAEDRTNVCSETVGTNVLNEMIEIALNEKKSTSTKNTRSVMEATKNAAIDPFMRRKETSVGLLPKGDDKISWKDEMQTKPHRHSIDSRIYQDQNSAERLKENPRRLEVDRGNKANREYRMPSQLPTYSVARYQRPASTSRMPRDCGLKSAQPDIRFEDYNRRRDLSEPRSILRNENRGIAMPVTPFRTSHKKYTIPPDTSYRPRDPSPLYDRNRDYDSYSSTHYHNEHRYKRSEDESYSVRTGRERDEISMRRDYEPIKLAALQRSEYRTAPRSGGRVEYNAREFRDIDDYDSAHYTREKLQEKRFRLKWEDRQDRTGRRGQEGR